MGNYFVRRTLQLIPVLLIIIVLVYFLMRSAPGDPVTGMVDPKMSPEFRELLKERLGLNQPVYKQFFNWVGELLRGNFGYSVKYSKPVVAVIGDFIWSTFVLSSFALVLALIVGIPAGIISATRQYSLGDYTLTVFSLIGISMPSFFFGLLLLKFFAIDHQWFPLFGYMDQQLRDAPKLQQWGNILYHMVLPGVVLGLSSMASFMRYTRSAMLEVIRQDYIRTARSKGLRERVVIYRHALRNAMIPIITLLGFQLPGLFSGAVITETIFGWPGLGKIGVDAVMSRDYGLLMAVNMMGSVLLLIGLLLSDFLYAVADPRIKYN